MGSKTRLSSYCTKRANNGVNLVTSRKKNTRLARPILTNTSHPLSGLTRYFNIGRQPHLEKAHGWTVHGADLSLGPDGKRFIKGPQVHTNKVRQRIKVNSD